MFHRNEDDGCGPLRTPGLSERLRNILGSLRKAPAGLRVLVRVLRGLVSDPGEAKDGDDVAVVSLFKSDILNVAVRKQFRYLGALALFSMMINTLYLSSSIYMMQVYDRVIPGGRVETLVMITVILVLAMVALAALESVRGYMMTRISMRLDAAVTPHLIDAAVSNRAQAGTDERTQIVRDFDTFRGFATGVGVTAFIDAPWFPIYLGVILLLHPFLAAVSVVGVVVIVLLALWSDSKTKAPTKKANLSAGRSYSVAEELIRNRETVGALRMRLGVAKTWLATRREMLILSAYASDRSSLFGSFTKMFRMLMQSSMLCFGSYLVIKHELSAGSMIGASILLGRALAPVEATIQAWKQFVSARDAVTKVDQLLSSIPPVPRAVKLPDPTGKLSVEKVIFQPYQNAPVILKGVSFEIRPGECVSMIGPSASGKTTLAKIMAGCMRPTSGVVRLDGAELPTWDEGQLQRAVGYIPQEVNLFQGTIAQNIARFGEATDEEVVKAAQAANAHAMIMALPNGYNTQIRDGGAHLSGGQRQRIGLARALFGDPVLLVLDEPNSHLDSDGEAALTKTVTELKERNRAIVLISHRPTTISISDKVLVLRDGMVELFGPTAEVITQLKRARDASTGPMPPAPGQPVAAARFAAPVPAGVNDGR